MLKSFEYKIKLFQECDPKLKSAFQRGDKTVRVNPTLDKLLSKFKKHKLFYNLQHDVIDGENYAIITGPAA